MNTTLEKLKERIKDKKYKLTTQRGRKAFMR